MYVHKRHVSYQWTAKVEMSARYQWTRFTLSQTKENSFVFVSFCSFDLLTLCTPRGFKCPLRKDIIQVAQIFWIFEVSISVYQFVYTVTQLAQIFGGFKFGFHVYILLTQLAKIF